MNKQTPTTLLRRITTLFVVLFVICSIFGFSMPRLMNAYAASVPIIIKYQGRILNLAGVPVSDSSLSMKFELYSASSGGSCLWSNSSTSCDGDTPAMTAARTITLTDGLFSESLGDTSLASPYAAIDETEFTTDSSIYLQVYIGGEELSPRKQLTSAPYAINADYLDGLDSTELQFFTDSGAVTYLTSATDDFAIGGTVFNASPFGVDESTNTVYIGDGSSASGSIVFKASDADTGSLSYSTDDAFVFSGGDIDVSGLSAWPSAVGTSSGMLHVNGTLTSGASGGTGVYGFLGLNVDVFNDSTETVGYDQDLIAITGEAQNSTSGELSNLYGLYGTATSQSTSVNAIGIKAVGVYGSAKNSGAGVTVPAAYGMLAQVIPDDGTMTAAYGISAQILSSSGAITTSYAGDFINTFEGTTRYGVRSGASGGTTNYSGYFYGAQVFVDNSIAPSTALLVDGPGDLYVYDQLEIAGNNQTTDAVIKLDTGNLITGAGLMIRRANSGTDFTGLQGLVNFTLDDTGSNGNLLYLNHDGTGKSLYIDQVGDGTALDVHGTSTTDYIAAFYNDGNADTNMGISIQACVDVSPTGACNYLIFKDGDGDSLGVVEGNGGGVVFASPGSDYAELFPGVYSDFDEGDILALDATGNIILATDDADMIGAFSTKANTLGNWVDGWESAGIYVPVALLGQVQVNINDSSGAIAVGDYITLSSTPGVGRRATGVGHVIGQALEAHTSGTGTIQVLVNPNWIAADILEEDGTATSVNSNLKLTSSGTATASTTGQNSNEFILRGSGWNGATVSDIDMSIITKVSDSADYGLSVSNDDGTEVAYISSEGNFAIAGRLYPSDRGTLQTDKYIYYDGSSGAGGDFMRTNASGWGAGSYDFAEMFPSTQTLSAGEVVIFASDDESVQRSTSKTYDDKIAGVVSTQPGFLAGENLPGHVPIALAGRVPTYVSGENGEIKVGDPLTTSAKPGYAMKATAAGPIVGYAMESFSGNTGAITVFIRPSYYDGGDIADAPGVDNSASGFTSVSKLDLSGSVNLNGDSIASIGSLVGIGSNWKISEDGQFSTKGQFVHLVKSYQGEDVETYAALSRNVTIQLTGTVELKQGSASIKFEDIDPKFNDIISNTQPYKVFLTADAPTNTLYAVNRSTSGFQIKENGGSSMATVDWMVIAYHKDFEPEEVEEDVPEDVDVEVEEVIDDIDVNEEEIVDESTDAEEVAGPISDIVEEVVTEAETVIEEEIIEEPAIVEEAVETPALVESADPELTTDTPVEEVVSTAEPIDIVVE